MFSKVNKFPNFIPTQVVGDFTFGIFTKEEINTITNEDPFDVPDDKDDTINMYDFGEYLYNNLNISEETKNLLDSYLSLSLFNNINGLIAERFTMFGKENSEYRKLVHELVDKLFTELINNNDLEELNIKHEFLYKDSLLNLIFKLYLSDKNFNINEQQILNCLNTIDSIDFVIISDNDNYCFYDSIFNLIIEDKYFNIILNKPSLFISIIGIIEEFNFPPSHAIRIFNKLQRYGFDDDIFNWCFEISKIINIDLEEYPEVKDHSKEIINHVLKYDKYIKKFNIENNENYAKWLNL